ncbi:hypothetical protein GGR10_000550 [Bartonella chomelii]|uniref:Uncharacterized protein n=1 Tax=Bartonella chomelii TaxID=236402 RepID=A0ABR6E309_9HYPH|nr:hypothetical protein [Bartonella chomelii]
MVAVGDGPGGCGKRCGEAKHELWGMKSMKSMGWRGGV